MGAINNFIDSIGIGYSYLSVSIPTPLFLITKLFIAAVFITLLVFLIWGFYATLSKRNFIALNLKEYNTSDHPVGRKLLALFLYFIEYILIMPALIILWFLALSIVLLLLVPDSAMQQILFLSGGIVMSIRILSYLKEDLSRELAKLFPFITLSIYLLSPNLFAKFDFFDKLKEIPILFGNIAYFLASILFLEIILRISYTIHEIAVGVEEFGED
ncbi:MAG: hypothetical protein Q7S27_02955 [Nanoarchaeota archaeon]|nr:hypothetical protein [Nanoarchaeota archaeon]